MFPDEIINENVFPDCSSQFVSVLKVFFGDVSPAMGSGEVEIVFQEPVADEKFDFPK